MNGPEDLDQRSRHVAKWMILLVRTDFDVEPKHDRASPACSWTWIRSRASRCDRSATIAGTCRSSPRSFSTTCACPPRIALGTQRDRAGRSPSALASERSGIAEVNRRSTRPRGLWWSWPAERSTERATRARGHGVRRRLAAVREPGSMRDAPQRHALPHQASSRANPGVGSETSINKLHAAELEVELERARARAVMGSFGAYMDTGLRGRGGRRAAGRSGALLARRP